MKSAMTPIRIFAQATTAVAITLCCSLANATPIHGDSSGLASPTTTITFDEPTTLMQNDLVTNQYAGSGVTFNTGLYYSPDDPDAQYYSPLIDGNFLGNYPTGQFPASLASIKLVFASQQTSVAFALAANYSDFKFEAFLGTTSVASYTDTVNLGYYGFTDTFFDSIVITSLGSPYFPGAPDSFDFDNLQFTSAFQGTTNAVDPAASSVPEPDAAALLGLGLFSAFAVRRRAARRMVFKAA